MALKLNIRYHLHKPSSDNPTPIYLVYHFLNKRFIYSTGLKIHPKYWYSDKYTQRPLFGNALSDNLRDGGIKKISEENKDINNALNNIEIFLKGYIQTHITSHTIPEITDIRKHLDTFLHKKINTKKSTTPNKTLLEWYQLFINEMKLGKRKNRKGAHKGKNMADSYIKSHGTTLSNIKIFQHKCRRGKELKFDDINLEWYHEFVQKLHDDGKAFNTVGCQIKNLKSFLKYAYDKGLHTNTIFRNEDFIAMREETDSIYLTEDELDKIYKLDLKDKPRYDQVRDLFILACYTALRYSDFSQLKSSDVVKYKSDYILNVKTKKTGKDVSIPLKKCAVNIMKKYNWNLPKALSNQKMNVYLKEIGKWAEINNDVTLSKTYNNETKQVVKPKYEFIGTHTARRTMATNMYLNEFKDSDIMSITGHKDVRVFRNYIKAESLLKAKTMFLNKSKYFK